MAIDAIMEKLKEEIKYTLEKRFIIKIFLKELNPPLI